MPRGLRQAARVSRAAQCLFLEPRVSRSTRRQSSLNTSTYPSAYQPSIQPPTPPCLHPSSSSPLTIIGLHQLISCTHSYHATLSATSAPRNRTSSLSVCNISTSFQPFSSTPCERVPQHLQVKSVLYGYSVRYLSSTTTPAPPPPQQSSSSPSPSPSPSSPSPQPTTHTTTSTQPPQSTTHPATPNSPSSLRSWWLSFTAETPEYERWSYEWIVDKSQLMVVFAITGSLALYLVRFIFSNVFGINDVSLFSGDPLHRVGYFLLMTPTYSLCMFIVGTLCGRHAFAKRMVIRMWSRFIPGLKKYQNTTPTTKPTFNPSLSTTATTTAATSQPPDAPQKYHPDSPGINSERHSIPIKESHNSLDNSKPTNGADDNIKQGR